MSQGLYISATISFVVTTVLIMVLRPLAKVAGLVDVPNERKVHIGEVPLVGGIHILRGPIRPTRVAILRAHPRCRHRLRDFLYRRRTAAHSGHD